MNRYKRLLMFLLVLGLSRHISLLTINVFVGTCLESAGLLRRISADAKHRGLCGETRPALPVSHP